MKTTVMLLCTFAVAIAAGEQLTRVKFDLANLDGKKGEYGSFTLEVRDYGNTYLFACLSPSEPVVTWTLTWFVFIMSLFTDPPRLGPTWSCPL